MRVIRFVVALAIVVVLSGTGFAESLRVGMGISVDDDQGTLYFPVEKGHYVVEPMIQASWGELDSDGRVTKVTTASSDEGVREESQDTRRGRAGVGFFRAIGLRENVRMLVGMRIGYEYTNVEVNNVIAFTSGEQDRRVYSEDLDGPFVEPLVSLEYALTESISFGGSCSVSYARLTGSRDENYLQVTPSGNVREERTALDVTRSTSETETAFYVKYYF